MQINIAQGVYLEEMADHTSKKRSQRTSRNSRPTETISKSGTSTHHTTPHTSTNINTGDPRFSHIQHDPRYRLPSRKDTHVKLDKRFSRMLRDDDFTSKAKVDQYGRRLSGKAGRRELERFYELDKGRDVDEKQGAHENKGEGEDDDDDADEDVERELQRVEKLPAYDPARQGGFSESSSEEEESSSEDESVEAEEDETGGIGPIDQDGVPVGEVSSRIAVVNLDWDNLRAVDLMAVASSFCPAGGRVVNVTVYPSEFGRERMEREELEGPPKELFASFKSGKPSNKTKPTDDGPDDQDEDEEDDDDDETIKAALLARSTDPSASTEIDTRALRTYQLSRLRYYYGVLTFDTAHTAHTVYNALDGQEYASTANIFDLRFIPDEVAFDDPVTDRPRDSCDSVPSGYRPNEFVTEALTHSKVSLTWDMEDGARREVQKRAFEGGAGDGENLMAYVGSDSSSDDEADADAQDAPTIDDTTAAGTTTTQQSKKEAARSKLRALLGLPTTSPSSTTTTSTTKKHKSTTKAPQPGNMQITFTAGLTSTPSSTTTKDSVFTNKPSDVYEETTRERYIRKEKERKTARRARAKGARDGVDPGADADADAHPLASSKPDDASDPDASDDNTISVPQPEGNDETETKDDPFADPFFTDPTASNELARKEAKRLKRLQRSADAAKEAEAKAEERQHLRDIMADTGAGATDVSGGGGFDMAAIRRREKDSKLRGKAARRASKKRRQEDDGDDASRVNVDVQKRENGDGFEVDVSDPRFQRVFESHEYAIDPTNPRFSGTRGMMRMLEVGRGVRRDRIERENDGGGVGGEKVGSGKGDGSGGKGELDELVRKVKRRRVV